MSFIDRLFRSRSEPVSEADLAEYLSGGKAWSGLDVDRATAMSVSAVWACVRVISETLASLPVILYKRLEKGKERAVGHPLYNLLHLQPNAEQSAFYWKETMQGQLCLLGNCYANIVRNGTSYIRELWPLSAENMTVKREGKELVYEYRKGSEVHKLTRKEVFHVPGLGFDGMQGYSVISMQRNLFGAAIAAERYGAEFFRNDAHPGGIIKIPGRLKDEKALERMRKSWQTAHKEWGQKHSVAILEEGAEWQQITIPPNDAQFIETKKFSITDIARIFRVPPHLIGDLERATFSNIEHQGIEFVTHTMRPWLVRWEQAISTQLIDERERAEYFAEFLVDALLRGDIVARSQAYRTFREMGVFSANDVRELENLNPIDGGDMYMVPMNWIPQDQAGMTFGEPVVDQTASYRSREERSVRSAKSRHKMARAFHPAIVDAEKRILKKEIDELRNGIRKYIGTRSLEDWNLYLDTVYEKLPEYIRSVMMPVYRSLAEAVKKEVAEELGIDAALTPENEEHVRAFVTVYISRHIGKSRKELQTAIDRAVDNGIPVDGELERTFEQWDLSRPTVVANNETVRGSNSFAKNAYLLAGVIRLRWVAIGAETCPFCEKLNGSIVGIEQDFAMNNDELVAQGQSLNVQSRVGHPPLHTGCVCQIVAA